MPGVLPDRGQAGRLVLEGDSKHGRAVIIAPGASRRAKGSRYQAQRRALSTAGLSTRIRDPF